MERRTRPEDVLTLASAPLQVASGEVFADRFRIVEHYGSGPLGHTYRAVEHDGRPVAFKLVSHALVPTQKERERVHEELGKVLGRSMKGLALPLAIGTTDRFLWVASRWITGRSLRRVLGAWREAGEPMPYEQVRGVLEGIATSLRELHQVAAHGALYPESVQIEQGGGVVLTDALLGVYVSRARFVDHLSNYPEVWSYLAPELRAGRNASAGADLYAIGALASEMLTGDPGVLRAGLAPKILHSMPDRVHRALQELVASRPAHRSAALPRLLEALGSVVREPELPMPERLPVRNAPTELLPAAPALVPPPPKARPRR